MERALKAAGKAPAKDSKTEEEGDAEDEPDAKVEGKDEPEAKEEKSERLQKLDKIQSHKHLAKAKDRLAEDIKTFEKDVKAHEKTQAHDKRVNDAVTEKYAPLVIAQQDYSKKDYRSAAKAITAWFGEDFPTIAKNIWNATKDGMATADLRQELADVKKQLAERGEKESKAETEAKQADEGKQLRASFEKSIKGHALIESADAELIGEAFDKWRGSWDPDLEEYSLSKKKAADMVLEKHTRRAEALTGRKRAPSKDPSRETKDSTGQKALKDMNPDERRKYHLDRAMRQKGADLRAKERHA